MKYISNTDLPSDPNGSLGNVRYEVAQAYNRNRDRPVKLALLRETLEFIIEHINAALHVEEEVAKESPAPEQLESVTTEETTSAKESTTNKPTRKRPVAKSSTRNRKAKSK